MKRKRLLALLLGIGLGLMLAEAGLRFAGYSSPPFYTTDPARGYALSPNVEGWYHKEGRSYVKINSQGLRDREHSLSKPPGVFRVALLGDSYCEAMNVPQESTFWAVLERERPGLEVINFGVSSYSTAQELITLREKVWAWSPDLVLLAFCTTNDVSDNLRALRLQRNIPYFVLSDGQLQLDDSFRNDPAYLAGESAFHRAAAWLSSRLATVQALRATYQRLRKGPILGEELLKVYREPTEPTWQEAWKTTEELIRTLHREASARGVRFALVVLSTDVQAHPDRAVREALQGRLKVDDLFYPDRRLEALARADGIPVLTLAPLLQAHAEKHQVLLHGHDERGVGHWNERGHALVGQLLAEFLTRQRLSK